MLQDWNMFEAREVFLFQAWNANPEYVLGLQHVLPLERCPRADHILYLEHAPTLEHAPSQQARPGTCMECF